MSFNRLHSLLNSRTLEIPPTNKALNMSLNMLASVYRSNLKEQMYLYVLKKDDFSMVPEELLKIFGKPEFSLQLNLAKRSKLARVDLAEVKKALSSQGFFLQMPPSIHENCGGTPDNHMRPV